MKHKQTQMTRDYAKGKIYMIEPVCEHDEGDVYYGSTIQEYLSSRMTAHRSLYKLWKNDKYTLTTSFLLFEKYGVDNCKMILVEIVQCQTKYELGAREAFYIRNNACVNKQIPLRTKKEYNQDNREHLKQYSLKNANKIREYKKQYHQNNADKVKQYKKEYYLDNAERLKEKARLYHQSKKDIQIV